MRAQSFKRTSKGKSGNKSKAKAKPKPNKSSAFSSEKQAEKLPKRRLSVAKRGSDVLADMLKTNLKEEATPEKQESKEEKRIDVIASQGLACRDIGEHENALKYYVKVSGL